MEKWKVGIIGVGMVGGSLAKYFEGKKDYDVKLYDINGKFDTFADVECQDFIYICVPVYFIPGQGCDLSIIEAVLKRLTIPNRVIILKSTVTPGTTDELQSRYPEHRFIFNPEFLTEETADNDTCFPDRQIVGTTPESYSTAKDVLLQLPLAPYERIVPARVAEMIKYAGNTWFSVKVAKNNELYDLAMAIGFLELDWREVVSGMAADKRIGRTHLLIHHKNKRGYSGKCLPKDTKQFLHFAQQNGVQMPVLEATDLYNDELLREQGFFQNIHER